MSATGNNASPHRRELLRHRFRADALFPGPVLDRPNHTHVQVQLVVGGTGADSFPNVVESWSAAVACIEQKMAGR